MYISLTTERLLLQCTIYKPKFYGYKGNTTKTTHLSVSSQNQTQPQAEIQAHRERYKAQDDW